MPLFLTLVLKQTVVGLISIFIRGWVGGGDVTHQQAAGRQLVRHAAALAPVTSAAAAASDVCCCTTSIFCNRNICVHVYTKTDKLILPLAVPFT
ncbi:unnamed protein product [Danaus chrysippus]|uniref:(African queen) hypothetical protein n=1 Tax=Danaus chrysippus TaxID=151541 RepID=A0A8J2R8H7_9NEOP|nr:unnamed protein product [Danaus chrysippus]